MKKIVKSLLVKNLIKKKRKFFIASEEYKLYKDIRKNLKNDETFIYSFSNLKIKIRKTVQIIFKVEIIKNGVTRAELSFNSKSYFGNADFVKDKLIEELNFNEYVKTIFDSKHFQSTRKKCNCMKEKKWII